MSKFYNYMLELAKKAQVQKRAMIIDIILDRQEDEDSYNPQDLYDYVSEQLDVLNSEDIARALDSGTEQDIKKALCEYIKLGGYNPAICDYINSVEWSMEGYEKYINTEKWMSVQLTNEQAEEFAKRLTEQGIKNKSSKEGDQIRVSFFTAPSDIGHVQGLLSETLYKFPDKSSSKKVTVSKKAREEWDWPTYRVTLKADDGLYNIVVTAPNEDSAIETVLAAENAPRSAVKKVKELSEKEVKEIYSYKKRAFKKLALRRTLHKQAGDFEEMMKLKPTDPKLIKYLANEFGVEESTIAQYTDISESAQELYDILENQANKYGYEWDKFEYDEYGDIIDEDDFRGSSDDLDKAIEYLKNNIDKTMFKFEYVGAYQENYLIFSVNDKLIPKNIPVIYVKNDTKNYDIHFFAQSQNSKEEDKTDGIETNDELTILLRRANESIVKEIVNYINVELPKQIEQQNKKKSFSINRLHKTATEKLYKAVWYDSKGNKKNETGLGHDTDINRLKEDLSDWLHEKRKMKEKNPYNNSLLLNDKIVIMDYYTEEPIETYTIRELLSLFGERFWKPYLSAKESTKTATRVKKQAGRYKDKLGELLEDIGKPEPLMDYISESKAKEICEDNDIPHEAGWYKGDIFGRIAEEPYGWVQILMDYVSESDARALYQRIQREGNSTIRMKKQAIIKHENGVYNVYSENGKCLGRGYQTKAEAEKRLKQVEYFKHKRTSLRDVVISKMAATGSDFYGPKEIPDEDTGTFRIKYYGGPGRIDYIRKSRNGKYHWKEQTHFDYMDDKPFTTTDYELAKKLVEQFGGEVEKTAANENKEEKEALAKFLDIKAKDLTEEEQYLGLSVFSTKDGEIYRITSSEETIKQATAESLEELVAEIGFSEFKEKVLPSIGNLENYLSISESKFYDDVYNELQNKDIEEPTDEEVSERQDKIIDDYGSVADYYVDFDDEYIQQMIDYGDANIDFETMAQDVIDSYGKGHELAPYDGRENEIEYKGRIYFIFREN